MNYVKIGKAGEFTIYFEPTAQTYFGKRKVTGEVIRADTLEDLKSRAKNYRNELSDYFAQVIKDSGLRNRQED